jgi:competence protein ComEC
MKILHFPLTKITFGFVLGIVLFPYLKTNPSILFISLLTIFVFLVFSFFINKRNLLLSSVFGFTVFIFSIFLGINSASIHKQSFYDNHYTKKLHNQESEFNGKIIITEKLKSTKKNYRFIAKIISVNKKKAFGKIIVNISKTNNNNSISIGSLLSIQAKYYKNKKPFNPNQFDYGKYLENQEIYAQLYCKPDNILAIGREKTIWTAFANHRENLINNLKETTLTKNSLTVLSALLLGQKQDISPELLKEYQYAGAVHILAVSGLHVGILMYFILFLLKPVGNSKNGKTIKLVIIILSLWAFATLTGLSPSVVRSVTMFSFLAIGTNLKRTVNIYHTLLVSMFVILLVNPSFIYEVGFQLSYLAVFFIVWLQPLLKKFWSPKNKILSYFWDILTVSTAAQIGTMPLTLYYFHQFPGLFFLTNLVVLPLLGIIMAVGVIVLLLSTVGYSPNLIIFLLDFLLQQMNNFIHLIATFENFVLKNISFSKEMLFVCYLVILFVTLWIIKPNFKRIAMASFSIILFQLVLIHQKRTIYRTSEGIVFNINKTSLLSERIADTVSIYANDSIATNINENTVFQSYIVGNFSTLKARRPIKNLLFINNQKIVVIDSTAIYNPTLSPDIVILIQSPKLNMERLLQTYNPKVVIADGSNYKTYAKLWEATCRKQKIPFHNTHEKGFYKF